MALARTQLWVGIGLVALFAIGEWFEQTPARWLIGALDEETAEAWTIWRLPIEGALLWVIATATAPARWAHFARIAGVAAAALVLYFLWRNYTTLPRDVAAWLAEEPADRRAIVNQIRPWTGDFRMMIQVFVAFLALSAIDWLARTIGARVGGGGAEH